MDDAANFFLPAGFRAAGVHCGIKNDPAKLDLALFVADGPAGVTFTQPNTVSLPDATYA